MGMAFAGEASEVAHPAPVQIVSALRQPVSLAAVVNNLGVALGVPVPASVADALDDPEPF